MFKQEDKMDIRTELVFWTSVMRDHGEFHYLSLSPNEKDAIEAARNFKNLFDQLNKEATALSVGVSKANVQDLIARSRVAVKQLIDFKTMMLKDLLTCKIELTMEPTFLNHQINEALEFYQVLNDKVNPCTDALENIRLHKVWLPDASGHAKYIASNLDGVEENYIAISLDFVEVFDNLFKKAFEMFTEFERTQLEDNALSHLNLEVDMVISDFISFLEELKSLRSECKLLATGTTSALIFDHMIREEKYYLNKIKCM